MGREVKYGVLLFLAFAIIAATLPLIVWSSSDIRFLGIAALVWVLGGLSAFLAITKLRAK
jgi:hypothetical protein